MENNENNQQTRVTSISVERVFNLGNCENIKYHIRVDVGHAENPGRVLTNLENIVNDLHDDGGVSDLDYQWAQGRVKALTEMVTKEGDDREYYAKELEDIQTQIKRYEEARARQVKAREALATLNYTSERKDHKENWQDDDDIGF